MAHKELYINGKWVDSSSQELLDVVNPSTEEVITQVPLANEQDIDSAISAARDAFPEWNALDISERAKYVKKLRDGIEKRIPEFEDTIVEELGASRSFVKNAHIPLTIDEMDATLEEVKDFPFEEKVENATVIREGFGVVAAITPWNYPLNQIQRKLTPALLAGNTVVIKPASNTPLTAQLLTDVIDEIGLPNGVFNLITGSGSKAGNYLAGHEDVDLVSFTGSTNVGKGLYEQASVGVKKLILELGGKSPTVLLPGGDIGYAVSKSLGTVLNNQGQSCSALTRLIVPKEDIDAVKEELLKQYEEKATKIGDPSDEETIVGPMVSDDQRQIVLDYIEAGKEEGATILVGDEPYEGKGYYVTPTIFTDVTNDMKIAREEIFGPVLTVLTYDTVEEAIEIANDSEFGLSGAVVGPKDEAEKVARQLRTGNISVNKASRNAKAPFGGYKQSGLGRENGAYGIEDYCELKAVFL